MFIRQGIQFCITGKLSGTRAQMSRYIAQHGGYFVNSIDNGTRVLVVGREPGRTKIEQARSKGILVISENEMRALAGERANGTQDLSTIFAQTNWNPNMFNRDISSVFGATVSSEGDVRPEVTERKAKTFLRFDI